jgi:predicted MarR family transcription regulator
MALRRILHRPDERRVLLESARQFTLEVVLVKMSIIEVSSKFQPMAAKPARRTASHLAASPHELAVTELEQALICAAQAFYRFIGESLGPEGASHNLSGEDNLILQQLMASSRPRGVVELARFANRDDIANIQYSLRKLIKAGMVEKTPGSTNRDTLYQVTPRARELTEHFLRLRRELVMGPSEAIPGFDEQLRAAARAMQLLTSFYDHGTRVLAGREPD